MIQSPGKKEKPNRSDQRYEVKLTVGRTLDGKLIRKSFCSSTGKVDAQAQAEHYKVQQEATRLTSHSFVSRETNFAKWPRIWLEIYKNPTVKANTYGGTYQGGPVENHLIPYFGKADLDDIRPAGIQAYLTKRAKPCRRKACKNKKTASRQFFILR